MKLRRLILPALLLLSLQAAAQSYFDGTNWDFGAIREADGIVSHTFVIFNPTASPLKVSSSIPSCTCIMAHLPEKPVAPGTTADIEVFYSPSGAVGPTHRTIDIIDSKGRCLGTLSTDADVTPVDRSIEERYPIVLAPCLYANMNTVPFGYMEPGESSSKIIYFANSSGERMYLEFGTTGSGLLEVKCPPVIGPGKEVAVMLTYRMPEKENYASRYDTLRVHVEGSEMEGQVRTSAICLTRTEATGSSPKMRVYPSVAQTKMKPLTKIRRGTVEISNDGVGEDLMIMGVELPSGTEFSLKAGFSVAPGKTLKAELTVPQDAGSVVVRLFTNDPTRPYKDLIFN